VFVNVNKYGNTSAASVAIALDEAIETGTVHSGDKLLLVAFGSGFTTAAIVLEW
jgi:3-oxoacyl-[acyl-carrier-protein] synthase-3